MKVIWWWWVMGGGCIGQKPGHLDASLELLNIIIYLLYIIINYKVNHQTYRLQNH